MVGLDRLNAASTEAAEAALFRCCGCAGWAAAVSRARPFATPDDLFKAAKDAWSRASRADLLEAVSHHPRIGDRESLRARFPATHEWSADEQSGVTAADERALEELTQGNRAYEKRFGHLFIVCASGMKAPEMLALLRARLSNEPGDEERVAAGEQMKITRLRLEKLLQEDNSPGASW